METKMWRYLIAVACAVASTLACAQTRDFPNKPVRVIVPTSPGGIIDLVTRLL